MPCHKGQKGQTSGPHLAPTSLARKAFVLLAISISDINDTYRLNVCTVSQASATTMIEEFADDTD